MSAQAKPFPRERTAKPPRCLCLECRRPECHGIGKPLSNVATIQASAPKLCNCPSGKRCSP